MEIDIYRNGIHVLNVSTGADAEGVSLGSLQTSEDGFKIWIYDACHAPALIYIVPEVQLAEKYYLPTIGPLRSKQRDAGSNLLVPIH